MALRVAMDHVAPCCVSAREAMCGKWLGHNLTSTDRPRQKHSSHSLVVSVLGFCVIPKYSVHFLRQKHVFLGHGFEPLPAHILIKLYNPLLHRRKYTHAALYVYHSPVGHWTPNAHTFSAPLGGKIGSAASAPTKNSAKYFQPTSLTAMPRLL